MSNHHHTFTNVRDDQGRTLYVECIERRCTRRMSPREMADQSPTTRDA